MKLKIHPELSEAVGERKKALEKDIKGWWKIELNGKNKFGNQAQSFADTWMETHIDGLFEIEEEETDEGVNLFVSIEEELIGQFLGKLYELDQAETDIQKAERNESVQINRSAKRFHTIAEIDAYVTEKQQELEEEKKRAVTGRRKAGEERNSAEIEKELEAFADEAIHVVKEELVVKQTKTQEARQWLQVIKRKDISQFDLSDPSAAKIQAVLDGFAQKFEVSVIKMKPVREIQEGKKKTSNVKIRVAMVAAATVAMGGGIVYMNQGDEISAEDDHRSTKLVAEYPPYLESDPVIIVPGGFIRVGGTLSYEEKVRFMKELAEILTADDIDPERIMKDIEIQKIRDTKFETTYLKQRQEQIITAIDADLGMDELHKLGYYLLDDIAFIDRKSEKIIKTLSADEAFMNSSDIGKRMVRISEESDREQCEGELYREIGFRVMNYFNPKNQ